MRKLKIYTDGGARGNPGPAATGVVVYEGSRQIARFGNFLGTATNNFAEYSAVIDALEWLRENVEKVDGAGFFLDSELVVKQLTGVYKIKSQDLAKLYEKIKELSKLVKTEISFTHIPRSKNREADAVVNRTLDIHAKRA